MFWVEQSWPSNNRAWTVRVHLGFYFSVDLVLPSWFCMVDSTNSGSKTVFTHFQPLFPNCGFPATDGKYYFWYVVGDSLDAIAVDAKDSLQLSLGAVKGYIWIFSYWGWHSILLHCSRVNCTVFIVFASALIFNLAFVYLCFCPKFICWNPTLPKGHGISRRNLGGPYVMRVGTLMNGTNVLLKRSHRIPTTFCHETI